MSKSTVEVTSETREMLKAKKKELGLPSVEAVILHLCANSGNPVEEASSSGSEGEAVDEAARRRTINVREPLYSLDILTARASMLEYYTGFDRSAVDLLIRRIGEVSVACHVRRSPQTRCRPRVCVRLTDHLLAGVGI